MILKISLKPLDRFFFGGENGFRDAGSEEDDRRSTYILHSRNYPQQTAMLGLIRNQLLLQNGLLWDNTASVSNRKAAKVLIGNHSFRKGYKGAYGVIEKLGLVYLSSENGSQWLPTPLDDVLMEKDNNETQAMFLKKHNQGAWLQGYDEKSGIYPGIQNDGSNWPLEKAFSTLEQVGITKAAKPWGNVVSVEEEEQGYYYQGYKKFAALKDSPDPPTKFVFYLELKDSLDEGGYTWNRANDKVGLEDKAGYFNLRSGIVECGGERSTFWMNVESTALTEIPIQNCTYHHTTREAGIRSLVCLSPALVDPVHLRELSLLTVSQSLPFRFFKSKLEKRDNPDNDNDSTTHYQSVYRGKDNKAAQGAIIESRLFHLLDRGSVIHFDPDAGTEKKPREEAIKELFNQADLQNIGYNQYSII